MRVVDAGTVPALRSQALWHGIAAAMDGACAPTLSFCRPAEPYVGLGYHRALDEIDLGACRRLGLPVIRRQIGGGPVYLDADQLFFQITLPADTAPARVDHLYERLLEPAAEALRTLGLHARRNGLNDLAVDERKISGTGAGRIDDGVTVVGNVLFRFPHERMVEVLALASERMRSECLRLMRRHVSSLESEGLDDVTPAAARDALVEAYGRALGRDPVPAALTEREEEAVRNWETRFQDRAWLDGHPVPKRTSRQVKISADAWVLAAARDGLSIEASVVGGYLERVFIDGGRVNGAARQMRRALDGRKATPEAVRDCLEPFGGEGRRVRELLEPGIKVH